MILSLVLSQFRGPMAGLTCARKGSLRLFGGTRDVSRVAPLVVVQVGIAPLPRLAARLLRAGETRTASAYRSSC